MAQILPPPWVWSTHDWTISSLPLPFEEAWVDVTMPGGFPFTASAPDSRRTYVVGTVVARDFGPLPAPSFSGAPIGLGGLSQPIFVQGGRQVVVLQCNATTSAGSGSQNWQRFFFGEPNSSVGSPQATNARAISVWETGSDTATRIAICGETFDGAIQLSQATAGWTQGTGSSASGFFAAYDGNGVIQWTHHFFSNVPPPPIIPAPPKPHCAITDVSIRVDNNGLEVVTYCGIFTYGDPGPGSELTPERPFQEPSHGFSSGGTTQAPTQYDGFVGRLVRNPTTGITTRVFHSIVGGPGQDGLFGLCEIDEHVFAVVGATQIQSSTPTGLLFPIVQPVPAIPGYLGAVLIFDARLTTQPTGDLQLVASHRLEVIS